MPPAAVSHLHLHSGHDQPGVVSQVELHRQDGDPSGDGRRLYDSDAGRLPRHLRQILRNGFIAVAGF